MKAGNHDYDGPGDLPGILPVFPLAAALLLPRGQMPLNIFEPRYLAMVDSALAGHRLIGMIQPRPGAAAIGAAPPLCRIGCAGRITSFSETGDGRYIVTLTGVARFGVIEELAVNTPYRQCRVSATDFAGDFVAHNGEDAVDRKAVLRTFRAYLKANNLDADWASVGRTSTEMLVNALAMMSPYGAAEKQALLEAPDLKARAETLVAITEVVLARGADGGAASLQ